MLNLFFSRGPLVVVCQVESVRGDGVSVFIQATTSQSFPRTLLLYSFIHFCIYPLAFQFAVVSSTERAGYEVREPDVTGLRWGIVPEAKAKPRGAWSARPGERH